MRTILIKILFRLLKVDLKTKDLVPFDDLKHIAGEQKAHLITDNFRKQKYIKALAGAYNTPDFIEWVYLQVVTKRNEHILTLDKTKKLQQQQAVLTFLMLIEEMRNANQQLKNLRNKK